MGHFQRGLAQHQTYYQLSPVGWTWMGPRSKEEKQRGVGTAKALRREGQAGWNRDGEQQRI